MEQALIWLRIPRRRLAHAIWKICHPGPNIVAKARNGMRIGRGFGGGFETMSADFAGEFNDIATVQAYGLGA